MPDRSLQMMVYGLPDGSVRLECDRFGCLEWSAVLPPHSTFVDVDRAAKAHTHPQRKVA